MSEWEFVPEKTNYAWLDVRMFDGNGDAPAFSAYVKADGCIGFYRHFNGQNDAENTDHIHICDVDHMIEVLQKLKAKAKEHYGEDWPQ